MFEIVIFELTRSLAGLRPASCSLLIGASQSVLVQAFSKALLVQGAPKVVLVQSLSKAVSVHGVSKEVLVQGISKTVLVQSPSGSVYWPLNDENHRAVFLSSDIIPFSYRMQNLYSLISCKSTKYNMKLTSKICLIGIFIVKMT